MRKLLSWIFSPPLKPLVSPDQEVFEQHVRLAAQYEIRVCKGGYGQATLLSNLDPDLCKNYCGDRNLTFAQAVDDLKKKLARSRETL